MTTISAMTPQAVARRLKKRIRALEEALRDVTETIECVVGDSSQCGDCVICRARKVTGS